MKTIDKYLSEKLYECGGNCDGKKCATEEEEVVDKKTFKEWARAKFEEVFGDKFDEEQFEVTLKGFLRDNKELVEKGDWGELVGMMNASFAK